MTLIDTQLPGAIMQTLDGALTCVAELILIAVVSQYMAILAPFLVVLLYYLQKYYLHTSRQMRLLDIEAKSPLYSNFLEAQSGVVTIRAFGWQKIWKDRNIKLLDESQRPYYLLYCIQRWLNLVLDLVVAAFAVVVMTLATQLDHGISGGSLGVAFINILSFSSSLAYLITAWTQLETSIGAIARVRSFEASTPSEVHEGDVQDLPDRWPDKGAVEFSDLLGGYKYVSAQ
jgi:ATP-binding cassette subfamily C (CFTR/MRP) protein 1